MSGIYAIADGIGAQQDANLAAQTATALTGIQLAMPILKLNQQFMDEISQDSQNYAQDTVLSVVETDSYPDPDDHSKDPHGGKGPHMAVIAAQDNTLKDMHQKQSDLQTGGLQSVVETVKSNAAYLGQTLDNVFQVESPILQLLAQTTSLIMEV